MAGPIPISPGPRSRQAAAVDEDSRVARPRDSIQERHCANPCGWLTTTWGSMLGSRVKASKEIGSTTLSTIDRAGRSSSASSVGTTTPLTEVSIGRTAYDAVPAPTASSASAWEATGAASALGRRARTAWWVKVPDGPR